MAQAKRAKYTSKGQRRNSKLHKPAPKAQVGNTNNAMREAFLNTDFPDGVRFSRLGAIIIRQASHEPKLTPEQQKGWSANLSFKTYQALKAKGVMA
jgi:hypothetical protein